MEALQRVSGVQVTDRGAGEVSRVAIRGLEDVTTTVNGRNIFTSSGLSVALADIPASLLGQVDIYKTRSSDLIETGIAGQIDIHTQRPFNFEGSKVVIAARGIYQEQADEIDPNISPELREHVIKGINDAVYGLMMVIDGVSGTLRNSSDAVNLRFIAQHIKERDEAPTEVVQELDLANGDGFCMGYHGWQEGDFGNEPVAVKKPV